MILTGNPKSTNHIYKTAARGGFCTVYMTKEGKKTKNSYTIEAKKYWKKKPTDKPLSIQVCLYFGDKRRHDIDNYGKLLLDSLTGIVWIDDEQIQEMYVAKKYDKKNPRIEINITEL